MRDQIITRVAKAISGAIQRDIVADSPAALGALSFDELGLDSIAVLSVLVAVEDEFNIEFSDETPPEALRSLGKLADYLEHAYLNAA
jgi:acyl carrier protein